MISWDKPPERRRDSPRKREAIFLRGDGIFSRETEKQLTDKRRNLSQGGELLPGEEEECSLDWGEGDSFPERRNLSLRGEKLFH
jgi:hypothetical protein